MLVVLIGHHSVAFEHQAVRIVDKILRLIRSVTEDIAIDAFAYVRIIPQHIAIATLEADEGKVLLAHRIAVDQDLIEPGVRQVGHQLFHVFRFLFRRPLLQRLDGILQVNRLNEFLYLFRQPTERQHAHGVVFEPVLFRTLHKSTQHFEYMIPLVAHRRYGADESLLDLREEVNTNVIMDEQGEDIADA